MYIDVVPNRGSRPTALLREGWREGKKTFARTIANISHWPDDKIKAFRALLKGKKLVPADEAFTIEQSVPHGHVEAVLGTIKKLNLDTAISSKPCRERNLVLAMIAERLIYPCSKLATTRLWHSTTLASELSVEDANEEELYKAMDWLLKRQGRIESKLSRRHFSEEGPVLYDVSSSYYEGRTCPLADFGHNKDGKKGKKIIVYGVMTDHEGRPIGVKVYPGNTGDPSTVPDQVETLRKKFGLSHVVLVGDRGLLTQTQIDKLKEHPSLSWISALRSQSIRKLVESGTLQLSLFDKQNLAEITSPEYPGERLIACFNPLLAAERHRKRLDLLEATEKELKKIGEQIKRRKKKKFNKAEIGIKVGKIINHYKMGKHFKLLIEDDKLSWERKELLINEEAALDGMYIIRTSVSAKKMSAENTVRNYKSLSHVERAFRSFKGIDILVRPIRHRLPDRVKAHIFLCLMAYYVEWHMRQSLTPLLFDDEELYTIRKTRDPVAQAKPSSSAKRKKKTLKTKDGFPVHSFDTLLKELGTLCRNRCKIKSDKGSPAFYQNTQPSTLQRRAFELLGLFPVKGN